MSYQIKFRGRDIPDITIDNVKGERLWEMWFAGNQKDTPVDAGNNQAFLVGDIKRISKVPDPVIQIPNFDQLALDRGKKCVGTYSIQREINQIIKSTYPKNWAKRISDRATRDKVRDKLKSMPGVLWCDYKTGECGC